MNQMDAVVFVKSIREQRARADLQRSVHEVGVAEGRLRKVRHAREELKGRLTDLLQRRTEFSGSAGDLLACDAAAVATEELVELASASVRLRECELREAQSRHARYRQQWQAAHEALRLVKESLRARARRLGTLRLASAEEDIAETRTAASSHLQSAVTGTAA